MQRARGQKARRPEILAFWLSGFWPLKGAVAQLGERLLCKQEVAVRSRSAPPAAAAAQKTRNRDQMLRRPESWFLDSGFWPSERCLSLWRGSGAIGCGPVGYARFAILIEEVLRRQASLSRMRERDGCVRIGWLVAFECETRAERRLCGP